AFAYPVTTFHAFTYQMVRHIRHIRHDFGDLVSEAEGPGHRVSKGAVPAATAAPGTPGPWAPANDSSDTTQRPGYRPGSESGSPNQGSTLLSKRLVALSWSPVMVIVMRPVADQAPAGTFT